MADHTNISQQDIDAVFPKVADTIADALGCEVDEVKRDSSLINDLGADSLAIVELVLALEEEFEIDIPDEETEKVRTVQDAVDYIQAHAKK